MKYLPKPDEYDKYWYIDTEADSLTPTRLWMMCASRMDQEEVHSFVGHEAIKSFFDNLDGSEVYFVGHNSISFDGPVIHRLIGVPVDSSNTIDTLVLSYLYNPSLPGGHSLGAWGERLNDPKGHFNDFSKYSKEMDDYCVQDVKLGKKVFKGLVTRMLRLGFSELSCQIEHEIREVIDEQQNNGWAFDIPGAQSLVGVLRAEQSGLEGPIRELFPPRLEPVKTYERRFKKDNSEFGSYLRHLEDYPRIDDNRDGTYTTFDWKEFNIGSPAQRVTRLLELGYEPVEFTPKTEKGGGGNPKVDEESLLAFAEKSGRPEVKAIAEWLVLQGRATMVEGWLNNVNYEDSRMHGRVITCGAASRRAIHNSPNCVPLSTQALTRNGWRFWNELEVGEDIMAYDMSTKTKKWTPLLDVSVFDEAEVYSFGQKHPRKRLYCTKNHSWVNADRDFRHEKEVLKEAFRLKHNARVRINAPFDNDVKESNFVLIQEKYERDWVSTVCKLSNPELNAFMQGFLLADGCRHGGTWQFAQSEGNLLDAALLALYLVSDTRISGCQKTPLKNPNHRMGYNVVQTKSTFMRTKDMSLRFEGLEPVWCPTTKFGTWIMKQEDFITITGNTANVPKAEDHVKYGKEVRSLWQASPGRVELGFDVKGLQNCMLAEYLGSPEARKMFTEGDSHLNVTRAIGFPDEKRSTVKNGWYALIFGAYDPKLGRTFDPSLQGKEAKDFGAKARALLWNTVPGLDQLMKKIAGEFKRTGGLLRTFDGGFVRCPSEHAALNYLLQSAEAVVMKKVLVLIDRKIKELKIDALLCGWVHDEGQYDVNPKDVERLGEVCIWAIGEAGRVLGFVTPLTGSWKSGPNWSTTH